MVLEKATYCVSSRICLNFWASISLSIWDAWVAQQLSACLQLRSWSWSPGIESHIDLPAWSLLLPLPVSLPLSLSLCLSWINKLKKIFKKKTLYCILEICWDSTYQEFPVQERGNNVNYYDYGSHSTVYIKKLCCTTYIYAIITCQLYPNKAEIKDDPQ